MTSISSAGLAAHSFTSPREMLQNELLSEVSSGAISTDDQDALSAALDDIDSTLRSQRPSPGSARPSPSEMKSKIEDLIASEVQNGKLTSDQAEELKNVFANAFSHGPGGAGGPGGPGAPGGPGSPGGPGGACAAGGSGNTSGSSDSSDQLSQMLDDFLKLVQQSLSKNSNYDASGDTGSVTITALVINYQA
jgi:hypothetical protein